MDVIQQYSYETLIRLIEKINRRDEQSFDMLKLLMMCAEDNETNQKKIIEKLEEIDTNIEVILEKLTAIESEFADLKNENREVEQKITLMISKLSKLDSDVKSEDLEDYYALAQSLYYNWDELDELTRKFIPLAEYLYSKLQKYGKADYSPVILELCRAIENEFLLKIFKKYTLDVVNRKGNDIDSFLKIDRSSYNLKDKTATFAKIISRAVKTRKPEYTLGQMNTILSIMKEEDTVRKSPLLQDFKSYLEKNTEIKNILDLDYIQNINDIVKKYRNQSAHPEFMSVDKANECRELMPERIDYLIDCMIDE